MHIPLWWDTLPADLRGPERSPLPGDLDVDVAIVGAGYTGLWSAYYLAAADPSLRIVMLEQAVAGFGASGRNGGWCSALFPASLPAVARPYGREPALALQREMRRTIDEVRRVADLEGIDCHFTKGGTVVAARSQAQLERARAYVAEGREWGDSEDDLALLGPADVAERIGATDVLGGTYTPHCAAIHPARLVRGLAAAVERHGVRVHEHTPVTRIEPRRVETPYGTVRADIVLRATEGYTAALPGHARTLAPVYSLMIATEPLPDSLWDRIGLARRETFADFRHMIIYGQRTADGRLAFGGRGAPYHFRSRTRPVYDSDAGVHEALHETLLELFPVLAGAQVTHRWGGPLGVPRDWFPSCGLDVHTGLGWAGGYVGDGVATSNLAGRTLADLVLARDSDLVKLAWVGHHSPRWEPEPFRWLGVNAALRLMQTADAAEARKSRPSRRAAAVGRLVGD